jgi:integrase
MAKRRVQRDHRRGVYCVYIRRNGVRRYFNLGANRKKAEKKLIELEQDIAAGKVTFGEVETTQVVRKDDSPDIRIEELAVLHLDWVKKNRALGTFKLRQHYLLKFLDFIGEIMVSEISRMKLEQFYGHAKATGGDGPNAGKEAMRHVKTMFLWGEELEICTLSFKKFPEIREVTPEVTPVTEDELAALLNTVPGDFKDMILFGLLTGLRPEELRELKKVSVRHSSFGDTYVLIPKHKTSRSAREPKPRSVPLSRVAEDILERRFKAHPKSEYVFLNGKGEPYTRQALRNRLIRWCRRAGIRDITPYLLRHTFASMQSDSRIETTSLARLMGHTTNRTVERYVHNTFEHHKKAVAALERRLQRIMAKCAGEREREPSVLSNQSRTTSFQPRFRSQKPPLRAREG